jgi:hypothetical protein
LEEFVGLISTLLVPDNTTRKRVRAGHGGHARGGRT